MSLKLLIYILERASLEYASTGSPYALERAIELLDAVRDGCDRVEDLLFELKPAQQEEA